MASPAHVFLGNQTVVVRGLAVELIKYMSMPAMLEMLCPVMGGREIVR